MFYKFSGGKILKLNKKVTPILMIIIVGLMGLILYQNYKVTQIEKSLTMVVQENLHGFAGIAGNMDSESYMRQFAYVNTAHEAYAISSSESSFTNWDDNLAAVLLQISTLMKQDKEKFNKIFSNPEASKLLFKIGDDFTNKDLIRSLSLLVEG